MLVSITSWSVLLSYFGAHGRWICGQCFSGLVETDKRSLHFLELFVKEVWNNFGSNTSNHNLNVFREGNMTRTCSAFEARDHQKSWDFYARERFLLGLGRCLLIHKKCTQSVGYFSCFDFLPILELSLQSTHLVKFLLDFHTHASWMFLAIVLKNLFSKFCILVETNSCQKLTISNSPTNQVKAEDSTTMLLFHSPTFQQSDLSSFRAKEGCFFFVVFSSHEIFFTSF